MISLAGITKTYGAVTALCNIDLTVDRAEVLALAGENGSGKSTLVKILSGVVLPDSGTISIDGRPVTFTTPLDALDHGIALVAQELTVLPHLPVYENVMLPFLRHRTRRLISRRNLIARTTGILDALGVQIDPCIPVSRLGPVQQTFVEIAKALVVEPKLLILDEATSRLGEQEVEFLLALIKRLKVQGLSTIMITHRIAEMTSTADRAFVLRDGKFAGQLLHAELNEHELVNLMVGRTIVPRAKKHAVSVAAPRLQVQDLQLQGSRKRLTLEVQAGEIVGLAGLVGAGRTELLEALAGVRRTGGGTVAVDGHLVPPNNTRRSLQHGLALVPEDRHTQGLIVSDSIHENYELGAVPWHGLVNRKRGRARTRDAVARFGVKTGNVLAPVTSLSGGNQQKIVIARALSKNPTVLLLDEPTRGVDIGARDEIYQIIEEQARTGMAVLMASSDMLEILGVCDRVLVMHENEIVGDLHGALITEHTIALLSTGGKLETHVKAH
ncbi:sugar ABC transporter ATP-binding protein [Cryobacterium sp. PH29-G1]|uniref:sugar ABC transporter ATP-binding protein n=1 Tax=Cryobacterium sp. PH29-G1 TaxID=3046211 RepID=UPI0024BA3174|nr:sugar ABC transporter ATP-binding protein [Cryobacterium sp. PH29-G1]MDJ0349591.1 sugar ABC transporter ATP-binding protein [Cryobacterium sp. PH29-G1]